MKTRDEILGILRQLKPELSQRYALDSLALFGSVARGDTTPQSDIDLLVSFRQPIGLEIVDLADELERVLGVKVDLVSRKFVRPRFWQAIAHEVVDV
jgi:predicted nucleotidyltransferase